MGFSRLIILFMGVLYPGYCSYKSLKNRHMENNIKWLTYWMSFAVFTLAECVGDVLLTWLPFYNTTKVLFILWLLSPITDGSKMFYLKCVLPLLAEREKYIDGYISNLVLTVVTRLMPATMLISQEFGRTYRSTLLPLRQLLEAKSRTKNPPLQYYRYGGSTVSLPLRGSKSEVNVSKSISYDGLDKCEKITEIPGGSKRSDDVKKMLKINFRDKNIKSDHHKIEEVYIFFQ